MRKPSPAGSHATQIGGITILVALMMLVLLTLAAVGMSRNSFREVVSSGFSRQGAMARNVADSGLEWCLFWLDPRNSGAATGNAASLVNQKAVMSQADQAGLSMNILTGAAYPTGGVGLSLTAGMELPAPTGLTEGYTMGLTYIGHSEPDQTSQGVGQGVYSPASGSTAGTAMAPTRWAARVDAQVQQAGVTFVHAKEGWVTIPATQQ